MKNPYYDAEALGLTKLEFNRPIEGYRFNDLCFWSTGAGRVYTADDGGYTYGDAPFANHKGNTKDEVLQKLERVSSISQAEIIFDRWNKYWDDGVLDSFPLPQLCRNKLSEWVKIELGKAVSQKENIEHELKRLISLKKKIEKERKHFDEIFSNQIYEINESIGMVSQTIFDDMPYLKEVLFLTTEIER